MLRTVALNALAALLALLLFAAPAVAAPEDLDFFTDFEDIDPNTTVGEIITVGVSPETADLGGDAFAGVVGDFALYFSGIRAWMVLPGGTGTITFDTLAAQVEFFATAHPSAVGTTVITAFDEFDAVIAAVTLNPAGGFQLISFTGEIDHIDVVNNDGSQMNGIDDFGFTPVPEPGKSLMLFSGVAALAVLRRRRNGPRTRSWKVVLHSTTAGATEADHKSPRIELAADHPRWADAKTMAE
jgi:hypothetical protein